MRFSSLSAFIVLFVLLASFADAKITVSDDKVEIKNMLGAPDVYVGHDGVDINNVPGAPDIKVDGAVDFDSANNDVANGYAGSAPKKNGTSFVNAKLNNLHLNQRDLRGADFTNAELTNASFRDTNLQGASFVNLVCRQCDFKGANLQAAAFANLVCSKCDFRGANVFDADFTNADFTNSLIAGVDFSRSNMTNAILDHADTSSFEATSATVIERSLIEKPVAGAAKSYHTQPNVNLAIYFEFDKDELMKAGWDQLAELAKALKSAQLVSASILIEGHTDAKGSDKYNDDLSYRRATRVMQTLEKSFGIDGARLSVKGYGEQRPVASNDTEFGRAQNRRVTIVNLSANQ